MNRDSEEMNRLLEETKGYYRQRASQYSDWAHRTGDYKGDSEPDASWFVEGRILLNFLETKNLTGNVLESRPEQASEPKSWQRQQTR